MANRIVPTCSRIIQTSQPPVAFISGAGAKTARMAVSMLLKSGVQVVALTGQDMAECEGLHVKKINRSELTKPAYINDMIIEAMGEIGLTSNSHIIGINLIGGAVAPKGSTLEELNHDIPISFFEGLLEAAKDKTDRVSLAQLSSITITLNGDTDCPYVNSKKKAEESLFKLNPNGTVLSLRPGMICPAPGLQFDTTHDYAVEQLARLPMIPILGSGNQIMQPVGEECLYTALINAMLADKVMREIVNAVGSETLTQKELFAYFAPQKNPSFIHIPAAFARVVAKEFPKGRIAPYAIEIFREQDINPAKNQPICGERFTQLVGRRPQGVTEIYDGSTLVTRKAPVVEHIGEMVRSPLKAFQVAAAAVKSLKDVYFTTNDHK